MNLQPTPMLAVASLGCCAVAVYTSSNELMEWFGGLSLVLAGIAVILYFLEIRSVDPYQEEQRRLAEVERQQRQQQQH